MQDSNLYIDFIDLLIALPFFLLIIFISNLIKRRYIKQHSEYKYFVTGIIFKILGVTCFCLIYVFYYKGGDTVNYFRGTEAVGNLLLQDINRGFAVLFNTKSHLNSLDSFNSITGW